MSIKILVDSASDISKAEAKKMGIHMVPMTIAFGNEEYKDGVDLLPSKFYEKLIDSDQLPTTSQVTPFQFEEELSRLTKNGNEVIIITISSKLSGTYSSAKHAAASFEGKVYVVDSLNACIGERLLCEYALRLIEQGNTAISIVEELNRVKGKIHLMALLGTLEYLKKGGRISAVTAFAGELFALKPVVSIIDGEVKLVGKARGSKNGNNLLTNLVNKAGGIDFNMPFGVVYSGTDDTLLEKYVSDSVHLWKSDTDQLPKHILGGTIGTHIGPGAIGVAFFEK